MPAVADEDARAQLVEHRREEQERHALRGRDDAQQRAGGHVVLELEVAHEELLARRAQHAAGRHGDESGSSGKVKKRSSKSGKDGRSRTASKSKVQG